MKAERWQQIERLYHSTLEREVGARARFLAEACAGDEALRREVESLLAYEDQAEGFIESPALEVAAQLMADEQGATMSAGQTIKHYRVSSLLGAGGMGEVYLASDTRLGRRVALKFLPAHLTRDKAHLRRFEQEARAVAALSHPSVCTIHEVVGTGEGRHCIVMEYVEGVTLRERLAEGRMKVGEALDAAIQVASALAAAHAAGVVHRDIKPENIMLRRDGYVKVLDFGLAKLTGWRTGTGGLRIEKQEDLSSNPPSAIRHPQLTAPGVVIGTVAYMSPEQARGLGVDARTDIWSLGVVLYEMLTGRAPFAGETPSHVTVSILESEPPPLARHADAPAELERIITKTLRKDKAERHQTASDLALELKSLKQELEIEARVKQSLQSSPELAKSVLPPPRKSYWPLAATVILLLGAISVGSWLAKSNIFSRRESAPILAAPFRSERFSNSGKVGHAALSPDGTLVAYTDQSSGKYSIWLRRLETADNVQLVPPLDEFYFGLVFAHDGRSIFFVRGPLVARAHTTLYRVSIFGGLPEKILERTQGWLSLSPDDRQLSFVRCEQKSDDYCSLLTADVDGRNERKILTRSEPIHIGDNQFSPDGKSIAFAVGQSWTGGSDFQLRRVDLASGAESQISPKTFFSIKQLKWLPGGDNLLVTATESLQGSVKIWLVSAATGAAAALTTDAENYSHISLDKEASKMIATQVGNDFHLYFSAGGSTRMLVPAAFIAFAPDGKIVYSTFDGNIWTINRSGGEQRQLTNSAFSDLSPRVSPDGHFIFFTSNRSGTNQIWRMNADGSNQTQLTKTEGGYPRFVTPDGQWVYYESGLRETLWKVAADGGGEMQVSEQKIYSPAFTPDGRLVAYLFRNGEMKIGVLSLADNKLLKVYTPIDEKSRLVKLAWSGDNRTLNYVTKGDGKNSLWQQRLDEERPRLVADLGDKQIHDFAVAPGGEGFAYVRGEWLHNAVLISGLK